MQNRWFSLLKDREGKSNMEKMVEDRNDITDSREYRCYHSKRQWNYSREQYTEFIYPCKAPGKCKDRRTRRGSGGLGGGHGGGGEGEGMRRKSTCCL